MRSKLTSALVKIKRDPLDGKSLSEVLRNIKSILNGRAKAGYLFGSFASGKYNKFSDLDLIIVTETEVPFIKRSLLFSDLRDIAPAMDVLVYTPDEFKKLTHNPSAGFWKSVCGEMKRIF